ncbi:hypothetical protein D3C71_579830 [compost metagenome]
MRKRSLKMCNNKLNLIKAFCVLEFLFINMIGFSQTGTTTPEVSSPLDVLPSSPTVNSLGSYGGVNVGMASGTVQKSIDLYRFVSGPLSVPISASYASNGLKVNDNGGVLGFGWNVSMGGVIRHTIMGNIDTGDPRGLPTNFNPYLVDRQTLNYFKGLISYGARSSIDGEPDIFSFSFNGYSGKFILDDNGLPVVLNHSGIKIVRSYANQKTTFTVTTPDGVKYEFSENETSRKTGGGCGRIFPNEAETAHFLTKITHPSGAFINFIYTSSVYNYMTGIEESQVYRRNVTCNVEDLGLESKSCITSISTNTKLLQEINSPEGKIVFNYVDHQAAAGKILSGFKVYRTGDLTPIKQVVFNYLNHNSSNSTSNPLLANREDLHYRSFLKEIRNLDPGGQVNNRYIFDYLELNKLPKRFSNSQDYYGYFNGKNNSSLIPNSTTPNWSPYFNPTNANRNPDGNYVAIGMLSKITYPTGGTDSLIYEPNTTWERYATPPAIEYQNITTVGSGVTGTGTATSVAFTVGETQNSIINFSCDVTATDGPYPGNGTVELLENGVVKSSSTVQSGIQGTLSVILKPGISYQVRVKAVRGSYISCTANYSYSTGSTTYSYKNQIAGGARLAQVISKVNGSFTSKKYYYHKIDDVEKKSTAYPVFTPVFERETTGRYQCYDKDYAMGGQSQTVTLSSSSRFNALYFNDAPIYYSDVFEVDNETNGGISYQFGIASNSRPNLLRGQDFDGPCTSNDDVNGLELNRLYFKYNGTQVVPVRSIKTSYKNDSRIYKIHKAFVANERFITAAGSGEANPPLEIEIEPYDIMEYHHFQRWVYPDTVTTREYASNGTNYNEQIEVNIYDNPVHAQLSRKILLKSDGTKFVKQLIYPNDYSSGTAFINDMISNHLIGLPIESLVYIDKNSTKNIISGSITNYKSGGKGLLESREKLMILNPIAFDTFKFSNRSVGVLPPNGNPTIFAPDTHYINEFKILSYSVLGKPQEIKKDEAPSTTYLWGYNGLYPVLEVKNATYQEVVTVLTQAAIDNLNSSSHTEATMETLIRNAADKLRTDLPKAMVSSYTYKPLVGMTSKTDPRGIKETYTYDGMQRLQAILDHLNNVTKSVDYHYRSN